MNANESYREPHHVQPPVQEARMLVGGSLISGDELTVFDPGAPSQVVGTAPQAKESHVVSAVEAAARAFTVWRDVPVEERARLLRAAAERLEATAEDRARLLVREQGKVLGEARQEVAVMGFKLRHAADHAEEISRVERWSSTTHRSELVGRPRGVAVGIVPWNSPLSLMAAKVSSALVTGNTIVVKVPNECPLAALESVAQIADLFPEGAISALCGAVEDIGDALLTHPLVATVSFTGSVPSGQRIAATAAPLMKKLILELGGNDAALVLHDCSITPRMVDALARAVYLNAGQICMAIRRLYVHRSRYEELVGALGERLDSLKIGHGLDPLSDVGPLQNDSELERHNSLLEESRRLGAGITTFGQRLPSAQEGGYFVEPALVTDAPPDSRVVLDEQFSPILPVIPFEREQDAVAVANATPFGLSGSVWTDDDDHGWQVARDLEVGLAFVNNHSIPALDRNLPYGGVKRSGIGREGGVAGYREYLDQRGVTNFNSCLRAPETAENAEVRDAL